MAYDRRSFAGAAAATTLTSGVDGSTLALAIADATGWPSGSTGDFFAVIDRGTATEEKVRIASRTSLALTVASGGRGADGTAAVAHSASATIELCVTATDLDEANAHIADTDLDHHTQYLNDTRHDVEARHTFGAALGTPAAAASVGTAASAGTGDNPAREDHVHDIGAGAIDAANLFAAGVVDATALATDAVTNAKVAADAIDTAELVDGAVTEAKIDTGAVTETKLGDGAVTEAKLGADAVTAGKIADGAVDTTATLADAIVTMAKIASEAGTSYTPTLTNVTLGTGGSRSGRYFKFGRMVVGVAQFTLGTSGNVTGEVTVSVPHAAATGVDWPVLARAINTAGGGRAVGAGLVSSGGSTAGAFATSGTSLWDADEPFDWQNGSSFWALFVYEAAA